MGRGRDHLSIRTERQTHIYDNEGRWKASLPNSLMSNLWTRYHSQHANTDDNFLTAVVDLTLRYSLYSKTRGPKLRNTHKILPLPLTMALFEMFSCTTELFASPLDVTNHYSDYYSADAADCTFGAKHNAYSCKWNGSVFIHPPNSDESLRQAMKWSLLQTQHTSEPLFCTLVLPYRKGTAYAHFLTHPYVHILLSFPPNTLYLQNPYDSCGANASPPKPAKSAYIIVLVSNENGYKTYYPTYVSHVLQRHLSSFTNLSLEELYFQQWTHICPSCTPRKQRPNCAFKAILPTAEPPLKRTKYQTFNVHIPLSIYKDCPTMTTTYTITRGG